ncbi:hypothetical protein OC709_02330, partial ['Planchonia careya' phytoplasma]|nr:hypothetical protein ['Planchonia careya' phytoplasma]
KTEFKIDSVYGHVFPKLSVKYKKEIVSLKLINDIFPKASRYVETNAYLRTLASIFRKLFQKPFYMQEKTNKNLGEDIKKFYIKGDIKCFPNNAGKCKLNTDGVPRTPRVATEYYCSI